MGRSNPFRRERRRDGHELQDPLETCPPSQKINEAPKVITVIYDITRPSFDMEWEGIR